MLGEVVKFIMTVGDYVPLRPPFCYTFFKSIFEWFFKLREPKVLLRPLLLEKERPYSPAEQRHWRGYVINNECKRYIGKNPAYKSSNGF